MNRSIIRMAVSAIIVMTVLLTSTILESDNCTDASGEGTSTNISDYVGSYFYYETEDSSFKHGLDICESADGNGQFVLITHPIDGKSESYEISNTGTVTTTNSLDYIKFGVNSNTDGDFIRFNKDVHQTTGFLQTNQDFITPKDTHDDKYTHFYRAADSPDIVVNPSLGFNPYYLEDAIRLSTDNVTVTLSSGTYSMHCDFNGKDLTVKAAPGASVVIKETFLNGNKDGSSLTLVNLDFQGSNKVQLGRFSDYLIEGCTFVDCNYTMTPTQISGTPQAPLGTSILKGNSFKSTGAITGYALTLSNENIYFEGNTIDGFQRGVNFQGKGQGTFAISKNIVSNLTADDQAAFQLSGNLQSMTVSIDGNTVSNCFAMVAIHNSVTGTPSPIVVSENSVIGTKVGILYKSDKTSNGNHVPVVVDRNYFSLDGTTGTDLMVVAQNNETPNCIDSGEFYLSDRKTITNKDHPNNIYDDEDEYIPPIIIPSTPAENESDDDSTTVVACAAAAAVAALMAVFLIVDRRK